MPKHPSVSDICARVADSLKRERLAQQLSMTRMAADAGLSRQMISYVEDKKRVPSLDTLLRMSSALGVDLADIIRAAERAS